MPRRGIYVVDCLKRAGTVIFGGLGRSKGTSFSVFRDESICSLWCRLPGREDISNGEGTRAVYCKVLRFKSLVSQHFLERQRVPVLCEGNVPLAILSQHIQRETAEAHHSVGMSSDT